MLQPGGKADLALEPLGAKRGRELRAKHLQRDRPVVPQVLREIDRGHASAAKLTLDPIAVGQRGLQQGPRVRHEFSCPE